MPRSAIISSRSRKPQRVRHIPAHAQQNHVHRMVQALEDIGNAAWQARAQRLRWLIHLLTCGFQIRPFYFPLSRQNQFERRRPYRLIGLISDQRVAAVAFADAAQAQWHCVEQLQGKR